jgi:hypothetical protein
MIKCGRSSRKQPKITNIPESTYNEHEHCGFDERKKLTMNIKPGSSEPLKQKHINKQALII